MYDGSRTSRNRPFHTALSADWISQVKSLSAQTGDHGRRFGLSGYGLRGCEIPSSPQERLVPVRRICGLTSSYSHVVREEGASAAQVVAHPSRCRISDKQARAPGCTYMSKTPVRNRAQRTGSMTRAVFRAAKLCALSSSSSSDDVCGGVSIRSEEDNIYARGIIYSHTVGDRKRSSIPR